MHDEFLCHVTAYGTAGGQRIGVPLGTYRAPTLALALWWLRDRATWIAERLDPSPENRHFPAEALAPVARGVPDVPTTLRAWRDDLAHQDMIAEHLAAGRLIRVATRDDTTEYELLAESVDALRMDRALPAPGARDLAPPRAPHPHPVPLAPAGAEPEPLWTPVHPAGYAGPPHAGPSYPAYPHPAARPAARYEAAPHEAAPHEAAPHEYRAAYGPGYETHGALPGDTQPLGRLLG